MRMAAFVLCALVLIPAWTVGQNATGTLSGTVTDQTGAVIPGVQVELISQERGMVRILVTNGEGAFVAPFLPPDSYSVRVTQPGFTTSQSPVVVQVGDQISMPIQLKVGSGIGEVSVVESALTLQESATVGTVISREFLENLPLSGRTLQSLVQLSPGVMATSSAFAGFRPGQFSVNGQRESSNSFTVDGISANLGMISGITPVGAEGNYPSVDAVGSTISIASIDALEEFRIQTSNFSPEFGRSPGAQVSLVTRSGTNLFHGSASGYFRNDALDKNDYFAVRAALPKPEYSNYQFGGALGGPLIRNRTFFFGSYDGLLLHVPRTASRDVPSLGLRQAVTGPMRAILDAYPIPNGATFANGFAAYAATFTNPANSHAGAVRVDHRFGRSATVFGRYTHAPSDSSVRGTGGFTNADIAQVTTTAVASDTVTIGSTFTRSKSVFHDFRFNFSRREISSETVMNEFGGAVPVDYAVVAPPFLGSTGALQNSFTGTTAAFAVSPKAANGQRQIQAIENVSYVKGSHELKAGVDFRRISSTIGAPPVTLFLRFANQNDVLQGTADLARSTARASERSPRYINLSLFAQDTWRTNPRLTLSYGVRWDYNPPPTASDGRGIPRIVDFSDFTKTTVHLNEDGTWEKRYNNFAPRVGMSYHLRQSPRSSTIVRGGFGVFYDLVSTNAGYAYSSVFSPYSTQVSITRTPYPLQDAAATQPVISTSPPYNVQFFPSDLQTPYSLQWNAMVEQALGSAQMISVSYVANAGRRLYRTQTVRPNANFTNIFVTTNEDHSNYRALQVQFQRRLVHGFQGLASYTLGRARDTNSGEQDVYGNSDDFLVPAALDYGPADFDVRHTGTFALTYSVPDRLYGGVFNTLISGWSIDTIFRARSSTPLEVWSTAVNFSKIYRPNLVPGQPIYLDDPKAPGGRRLNRAAFTTPVNGLQGNLGRNTVRGFSAAQLDMSVRRQLRITEQVKAEMRAEVFNAFNRANLANPVYDLANARFGESTATLATSLGNLNPLYQMGGPRSIQLGVKVRF
jgi:hypothetical protein